MVNTQEQNVLKARSASKTDPRFAIRSMNKEQWNKAVAKEELRRLKIAAKETWNRNEKNLREAEFKAKYASWLAKTKADYATAIKNATHIREENKINRKYKYAMARYDYLLSRTSHFWGK